MRIAFIVNEKRYDETLAQETVEKQALIHGLTVKICILKPDAMEAFVRDALAKNEFDFYVAVGGDGTVRNVAQVLANQNIPMGILPKGTFNYFARELGITDDLEQLLVLIKERKYKHVDVGKVNELVFINHAAVGFYSHILKMKEKNQNWLGKNKLLKVIFNSIHIWRVLPIYHLTLKVDNLQIDQDTCLLFIGNNYHFTNLLDFGERLSLTSGYLSVYILKCKNRWELFKCITSILLNMFDKKKYLRQFKASHLKIDAASKNINIVVDGELLKLETPLYFELLPQQLMVVSND